MFSRRSLGMLDSGAMGGGCVGSRKRPLSVELLPCPQRIKKAALGPSCVKTLEQIDFGYEPVHIWALPRKEQVWSVKNRPDFTRKRMLILLAVFLTQPGPEAAA